MAVYIDPRLVKLICIWEYQVKGALTNDLNGKIGKFIAENTPAVEFNQCFVASLAGRKEEERGKGEISFRPDARCSGRV